MFVWIFLGVIVLGVIFVIGIYNRLVALKNRVGNAFSQIEVQLKRRYDLIPNLVETAKAYLKHERETLEAVIAARNQAMGAMKSASPTDTGSLEALSKAELGLTGTLGRLMVVSENYPELKADRNMAQLTEELSSTENKVAFARQAYNDSVMTYNTSIQSFPNNVLAGMFKFDEAKSFEVEDKSHREAVKVSF